MNLRSSNDSVLKPSIDSTVHIHSHIYFIGNLLMELPDYMKNTGVAICPIGSSNPLDYYFQDDMLAQLLISSQDGSTSVGVMQTLHPKLIVDTDSIRITQAPEPIVQAQAGETLKLEWKLEHAYLDMMYYDKLDDYFVITRLTRSIDSESEGGSNEYVYSSHLWQGMKEEEFKQKQAKYSVQTSRSEDNGVTTRSIVFEVYDFNPQDDVGVYRLYGEFVPFLSYGSHVYVSTQQRPLEFQPVVMLTRCSPDLDPNSFTLNYFYCLR